MKNQTVSIVCNDGYCFPFLTRCPDSLKGINARMSESRKLQKVLKKHKGVRAISYKFFQIVAIARDIQNEQEIIIDDYFFVKKGWKKFIDLFVLLQEYSKHQIFGKIR